MNGHASHRARGKRRVPAWLWLCLALGIIVYLLFLRGFEGLDTRKLSLNGAKVTILDAAIRAYYDDHKCFPSSLAQLAGPDGKIPPGGHSEAELRLDAWEHPFAYQLTADGSVTLASYGSDGQAGTLDDFVLRISPGQPTTRVAPESLTSQPSSMTGD